MNSNLNARMIYLEWIQMELHDQIKLEANVYIKENIRRFNEPIQIRDGKLVLTCHKPLVQFLNLRVYSVILDHHFLNVQKSYSFGQQYHLREDVYHSIVEKVFV